MKQAIFLRKIFLGVLLICAVTTSWFFRGIPLGAESTSPMVTNTPMIEQSTAIDPYAASLNAPDLHKLYELTAGLHPGRGEPIPDAEDEKELPVVDVSFYNLRGYLLSGWLSMSTPEAPVIILAHGTPGNRLSMLQRSIFLYNHGFNVLLFDFQSYGRSQGVFSTLGTVESEDILAAISFLHSLHDTMFSKIGVLGLSMGATAAVLAASRSEDILALVAESCPVDATRVPGDVQNDEARLADKQLVEEVYGVDIAQARPIDVVAKLAGHTPIFFINGDVDTTTPLTGMMALYQAASDPKQYWVVPGAGHAQSFSVDPNGYIQRVDAFFDLYLH